MSLKSFCLLIFLCLNVLFSQAQSINWQFENISDDIEESGANPHMEVDALGNIHLTYWKRSLDRLVYGVKRKTTGQWEFQDVPDQGTFGYKSSLKINNLGYVYIAYLKNQGGQASIRLAIYDGSTWLFEDASEGNTIGIYGYDPSFPSLVQPSLDLNFDNFGQPAILHFNGFYNRIRDCRNDLSVDRIYSQYRMDMNLYVRRGINDWEEQLFPNQAYTGTQPCVENGDRFGEFCHFLRPNDSTALAVTTSMHNNELLLYRSKDDSLKNWEKFVIDRSSRLFAILNTHFYETFGYIDAKITNDSLLHLTYNISNHYGYARRLFQDRLTYFYTRVNINRLDDTNYTPFHYNYSPTTQAAFDNTLLAQGDSMVLLAFFDRLKNQAISAYSTDAGLSWEQDTLPGIFTHAPMQSVLLEDTAFIAAYFTPGDRLKIAKRKLGDSQWIIRDLTQTQTTGSKISSLVFEENGAQKLRIAIQSAATDRILFGEKVNGEWQFESIDNTMGGLDEPSMQLDASLQPQIAYLAKDSTEIRLASKSGGNWNTELVTDSILAKDLAFQRFGNQLHLTFLSLNGGYLEHYSKTSAQNNWQSVVVDDSSSIVGSELSSVLDAAGGLHLAYLDVINNKVKYAYLPQGGSWSVSEVTAANDYSPKKTSIALDTLGQAAIAFTDGFKDTIFLATQLNGNWEVDRLEGEYTDFSGDALSLLIDDQNQAWVVYNYQTFIEDLRIYYRRADDLWQQVSVVNNSAEISNAFNFLRYEKDLYIVGKKNQIGNGGMGLLYAENGILAELEPQWASFDWQLRPNPSEGRLFIDWQSDIPDKIELEVYNLSGQKVYHKEVQGVVRGEKSLLNLSGMEPGLYLIRLLSKSGVESKKLIISP